MSLTNVTAFSKGTTLILFAIIISIRGLRATSFDILFRPLLVAQSSINVTVNDTSCANLPPRYVENVYYFRSIRNKCLQFSDKANCEGESIQIVDSGGNNVLSTYYFQNRTHSVRVCPDPCIPAVGKSIPIIENETSVSFPKFQIEIFSLPGLKGTKLDVTVNGCSHLDKSLGLVSLPESIRIPKGSCVLLFYRHNAEETGDERDCIVHEEIDHNVIEFQDINPYLLDISNENYGNAFIMAFSPCACLSRMNNSNVEKLPTFPGESFIILFAAPNFEGDSIKIPLDFMGCKTFREDEISSEWEGAALSLFVANKSCVVVYTEQYCPSNIQMLINYSIPLLSQFHLDKKLRSLRVCDEEIIETTAEENIVLFYLLPLSTLSTIVALGLIILQILMRRKFRKVYKSIIEKLSAKEVQQFMEGLGLELEHEQKQEGYSWDESGFGPVESKLSSDLLAQNQPYDTQMEIPLTQIIYDSNRPIGSGEFGVVFKGSLINHQDKNYSLVAIKTTKPHANADYLRVLLKEVKVMMFVGKHMHIVALVGCSTIKLREGILLVMLEFCENGSLETYMKANRGNFVNLVHKGQIHCDKKLDVPEPKMGLGIHQLITWSIEIAKGMEFLASKRVIHGDIAARNVLLTKGCTAKISDFGLSRKMYSYTHYTKTGDDALPWRWMALESLKNLQFSTASDAWGFGILLYEIFTLGEQPYPGVSSLTNNFITNLEEGLRPALPQFATSDIYNVMFSCWDENARSRPSFSSLISSLQEVQDVCNIIARKRTK